MRDKMMFLWWRAWHHRNNIIFSDGKNSIEHSISHLKNYLVTLQNLPKGNMMIDKKAKLDMFVDLRAGAIPIETKKEETWVRPPNEWVKCNVDASFIDEDRNSAWRAVLRDSNGTILCLEHLESLSISE
jgi:hypothetical protein